MLSAWGVSPRHDALSAAFVELLVVDCAQASVCRRRLLFQASIKLAHLVPDHPGFLITPPKRDTCTKHAISQYNAYEYGRSQSSYIISY